MDDEFELIIEERVREDAPPPEPEIKSIKVKVTGHPVTDGTPFTMADIREAGRQATVQPRQYYPFAPHIVKYRGVSVDGSIKFEQHFVARDDARTEILRWEHDGWVRITCETGGETTALGTFNMSRPFMVIVPGKKDPFNRG